MAEAYDLLSTRCCSGWTTFRLRASALGHAPARGGRCGRARQTSLQKRVDRRSLRVLRLPTVTPSRPNFAPSAARRERRERKQSPLIWRVSNAPIGSEEVQFTQHSVWTSKSLLSWTDQVKNHCSSPPYQEENVLKNLLSH